MRYSLPVLGAAVVFGAAFYAAPCAAQASKAEQDAVHARYADARRTVTTHADTLTVEVTNLPSDAGHVRLYLFDATGKFAREAYDVDHVAVPIVHGHAVARFVDVPYGRYALTAFQDQNDDGQLNTGLFGRPKEPFAFSSGAKNHGFSRPSFADASFGVNAPAATATVTF